MKMGGGKPDALEALAVLEVLEVLEASWSNVELRNVSRNISFSSCNVNPGIVEDCTGRPSFVLSWLWGCPCCPLEEVAAVAGSEVGEPNPRAFNK